MDKKTSSGDEHLEEKDENFLKKAAHSIRDKLHIGRDKKKKDRKSKSGAAGKTDSSSAVSDDEEEHGPPSKSSAAKKEPANSSSDPPSASTTKDTNNSSDKAPAKANNNDKVHVSFHGISTVDDLLDRIDEVVKSAKIVVEGDTSKTTFDIQRKPSAPRPSTADLDKKPLDKPEGDENKVESSDRPNKMEEAGGKESKSKPDDQKNEKKEGDEGPLQIDYNDIHTIEDLLKSVHREPGSRKVLLVNAPDDSESVNVRQSTKTPRFASQEDDNAPAKTVAHDKVDPSAPPKSILKTSQNPSSLDTSTKVASLKDDQIHVNIEGVQSMDELLDRIDGAVQRVPVVIDTKALEETRTVEPQPPKLTDNTASSATPADTNAHPTAVPSTTTTTTVTTTIGNDSVSTAVNKNESHNTTDNPVPSSAAGDEKRSDYI